MEYTFISQSKEETKKLGAFLAPSFIPGDVVLLKGDLGAGKTTLVSGVAKQLKIKDDVISPTFNIMKCYFYGTLPLYHIDAYRLEKQNVELGLDEYIEGNGVCFIEWPDFINKLIPDEHLDISLSNIGDDNRKISLSSSSPRFFPIIKKVEESFK